MAKAVRWRVPFVSLSGTKYEIEIYDEGYTGEAVTLQAGETPFVTDEDATDDFFAPIRTQTGTLQVCTAIPGGGTLRLEDILPENNIARPVRLVRYNDPEDLGDWNIDWQGFLSCEAYSQDYTSIPQILDLSVISVLEAMRSIECDIEVLNGVQPVHYVVGYALRTVEQKVGMSLWSKVYVADMANDVMFKYVDTSVFYDRKERINQGYEEHYPVGVSLIDALSSVVTFVGWCVRERGTDVFLQYMGYDGDMICSTPADMYDVQWHNRSKVGNGLYEMSNFQWRGAGHMIDFKQGAKSVEVTASVEPAEVELAIPDGMPIGSYQTSSSKFYTPGQKETVEEGSDEEPAIPAVPYASMEQNFSNVYDFQVIYTDEDSQGRPALAFEGTPSQVFTQSALKSWGGSSPSYLGALVVRIWDEQKESDTDIVGLYVNGTDVTAYLNLMDERHYCLKMRSVLHLNAYNGKLRINFKGYTVQGNRLWNFTKGSIIKAVIKWGSKYLQTDCTWSTTPAICSITYNEDKDGYEIPIKEYLHGEVQVMIMPIKLAAGVQQNYQYILTDFNVSYERPEDVFANRTQNTYFKSLGTYFLDEVTVENTFASNLRNEPSPALMLETDEEYDPILRLTYGDNDVRPELHLLDRLAKYYGKPRCTVQLETAPMLCAPRSILEGINDGKVYIPMAESRDWQMETSTITCMETPNE